MPRYNDQLKANLARCGVPFIEIDGWTTQGSSSFTPRGSTNHHTAGSLSGAVPSLWTCINGRSDVPGPLCNGLLGRDLVLRLITAGRANHAGRGGYRGLVGNSTVFGLEVEHVGVASREKVPAGLVEMAARVHAAFCLTGGYGVEMVHQHWEWTSRKIDFVKGTLDPNTFRRMVQNVIDEVTAKPKPPPPQPSEEDIIMGARDDIIAAINEAKPFAVRLTDDGAGGKAGNVFVITAAGRYHVDRAALNLLYVRNTIQRDPDLQPPPAKPEQIAAIPIIG